MERGASCWDGTRSVRRGIRQARFRGDERKIFEQLRSYCIDMKMITEIACPRFFSLPQASAEAHH